MKSLEYDQLTNRTRSGVSFSCDGCAEGVSSLDAKALELRQRVLTLLDDPGYVPPSLPERALELEHLCARVDTPVRELTRLLEEDSGLTAAVLRAANSAHAKRTGRAFTSISRAILQIGYNGVRAVSFAMATRAVFLRSSSHLDLMRDCFQHSLAVAHGSAWLAERAGLDHGSAYVAGLLHDIGKVIVLHAIDKLSHARKKTLDPVSLHAVLDGLHESVGGRFCASWGLSPIAIEACSTHHDADVREGITSLVASTNRLTRSIGLSLHQPESREASFAELAQQGLSLDDIDTMIASLQEHVMGMSK